MPCSEKKLLFSDSLLGFFVQIKEDGNSNHRDTLLFRGLEFASDSDIVPASEPARLRKDSFPSGANYNSEMCDIRSTIFLSLKAPSLSIYLHIHYDQDQISLMLLDL